MPGTIQVSVLEFKGITPSEPSASVFIKVSVGETEYQTWNKGEFSFPLKTLRDSLVVKIQDPEGNEMSSLGVQSMSIIEKGIWNDLFPLEGGGYLHMKLQFSLSEDEHNRIRSMRESALRKKQGEVLSKEKRYSEMASGSGVSIASSSTSNNEVSGKQAGSWPNSDTYFKDLDSNNWKEHMGRKQRTPNATDRTRESSSAKISPGIEIHNISLVGKIDTHLPHAVISEAPYIFQNYLSMSRSSEPVVAKIKPVVQKLEDNPVGKHEKQVPLRKPASSIMKMISAFETNVVQEKKPPLVQVAAKSQENRARKGPLEDQVLGHVVKAPEFILGRPKFQIELSSGRAENPAQGSSERHFSPACLGSGKLRNPFLTGSQLLPPDSMNKKGKHIDFVEDFGKTQQSPAITTHETVKSQLKSDRNEMKNGRDKSPEALCDSSSEPREHTLLPESMETREQLQFDHDDSFEDLMRSSPFKLSAVLEKVEQRTSLGLQPCSVYVEQKGSSFPSVVERLDAIKTKHSSGLGAFNNKLNSVASGKDEHHRYEISRAWIFPDDRTHVCITSGVSPVMEFYGRCDSEAKKDGLVSDNLEKHQMQCGSNEMNENESTLLNLRESKPENSADNTVIGPVKQAIKIAIVVGFGALVLFTRQREPRKNIRKANGLFFDNLP